MHPARTGLIPRRCPSATHPEYPGASRNQLRYHSHDQSEKTAMLKSFDTLIQLSQNKSDTAAIRLAQVTNQLADSEQKGKMLASYRDDYRARLDAAALRGATAAELANFRAFIAKLDEAVGQQEREIAFWREQMAQARSAWQAEQQQLQSYTTIATRRRSEFARVAARREQKSQDEFASRMSGSGSFAFGD